MEDILAPSWSKKNILIVLLFAALCALNVYQYVTRPSAKSAKIEEKITPKISDLEVIDRFHNIFYDIGSTWQANQWLGLQTWQNPNDIWIHQEIIYEVKPDFIIEAGTFKGGSAILWAMILREANPKGRVLTIDIEDLCEEARQRPIWKAKIEFFLGSSTDPKIVEQITKRVKGRKVMVIVDSDHYKDHVLNELRAYSPLVTVGSYFIVQDTNINGHPVFKDYGLGPMEAVEEFLNSNKQFESDRTRERLLLCMHPKGYLRRVK